MSKSGMSSLIFGCNFKSSSNLFLFFRQKYVEKFYEVFSNDHMAHDISIWVFLDVVLDHHFKELKTLLVSPFSVPWACTKLIPTITQHSPHLEKLTINFKITETTYKSGECEEIKSFILSLGSFQHLTQLSLLELEGSARLKVLSLIGKACPALTHFTIEGTYLCKKHILVLILGECETNLLDLNKPLPSWCEGETLEHLVVEAKFLSPICSTIRELKFEMKTNSRRNEIRKSEAAFALKHLPLLQVVDQRFPTSLAVLCLYKNAGNVVAERKSQYKFLKANPKTSDGSENEAQLSSPRNSIPFSGIFFN